MTRCASTTAQIICKKKKIYYLLEKMKTFGKQFFCILPKFICIARLYYLWSLKILIYVKQPIFILELFSFHNAFFLKCCVPFRITRCKLLLFLLKKDFLRKENLCDKSDSKERELTKKEDKDRKNRTGGKTTRKQSK